VRPEEARPPAPDAAVALVRSAPPDPAILLIRRSERDDDSWSGHWSLPGGRRDARDPDLLATALRELDEECGVRLGRGHCVTALPSEIARRHTGRFLVVAPFLFEVERRLATVLDPREAAAAQWVPIDLLRDPARHVLRPVPARPSAVLFPAVELDGPPLWGFTYRLLTGWLGVAPPDTGRPAGLEAAQAVLDFVLSTGLELRQAWQPGPPPASLRALVSGVLPVAAVVARFSGPGSHVLAVNRLEVRAEEIRIAGLDFEEYAIAPFSTGR